jgi:hypothetical protein
MFFRVLTSRRRFDRKNESKNTAVIGGVIRVDLPVIHNLIRVVSIEKTTHTPEAL